MRFTIDRLGKASVRSPLCSHSGPCQLVDDTRRILFDISADTACAVDKPASLELAGPRENLFFDPKQAHAAIVSCGGLCPGINNVIRSLTYTLLHGYGLTRISGIRYGYRGLGARDIVALTPEAVKNIHREGGSMLGNSRGAPPVPEMVNALEELGIDMLFTIGGDGTFAGAQAIYEEVKRRKLPIAIVGIPKTIDNDVLMVERTFGFETAFSEAIKAIRAANNEAEGAPGGIGLVKLMGRHSGYIAAAAALAYPDVNLVLVPEIPFEIEGDNGLLSWLEQRLARRHHAVIVVAEGAGQNHLERSEATDASGNRKLGDIGLYLKDVITEGLRARGVTHTLKYIDPSYIIRSLPALPDDGLMCVTYGQMAAHAALSGRSGMAVSIMNNHYVHVPLHETTPGRKRIDPQGAFWRSVVASTGQPF